jgi:hypothetical protein
MEEILNNDILIYNNNVFKYLYKLLRTYFI